MIIEAPEILNIVPKMLTLVSEFNNYRYFCYYGGRASGKTHGVARFILYLAEKRSIRVLCGRETMNTIQDSVFQVFADLIREYNLFWRITESKLEHRKSGSTIIFKGFREQGATNIKGIEGCNLLWIDEAQAITQKTLEVILPTIRKGRCKLIFTMNRDLPNDPVFDFCLNNDKCLMHEVNYVDNPFLNNEVIELAHQAQKNDIEQYNHVWLGIPRDLTDNMLFSASDVSKMKTIEPYAEPPVRLRIIGIDFAAQGNDYSVATVLDKASPSQWRVKEMIAWQEPDPMTSIGRIVDICNTYKPDFTTLDVGGMGYVVYARLKELGVRIDKFDGASTQGVPNTFANTRAWGYYELAEMVRNGYIILNNPVCEKQLLTIRYKYRSNGERMILSKDEMRRQGVKSPDNADSLMMAVHEMRLRVNDSAAIDRLFKPVERRTRNRWQL